jgi:transcriptional regulator with XRE-family HTH domain
MLSKFLNQQMQAQGLSAKQLRERSGNRISISNITKIKADLSSDITVNTANALSLGLRVPLLAVVLAALGYEQQDNRETPCQRICASYSLLSSAQRQQADYLLTVIERELERLRNQAAQAD